LGAELRAFPRPIMDAAYREAFALYGELAASNTKFKAIYDHFMAFRDKAHTWFRVAELPFDAYVYSQPRR
jgi:TRAP-type mannitol/chloroaromatic compound transport system substrate-binding protein